LQPRRRPRHPPPGAATLSAESYPRGAALAYRRLGSSWIRIDLADRLASHARKVRSAGGDDPVDRALATSIGLDDDALARLMNEIGFTRAGDAWKWRGRRGPPQKPRSAPSHAFAELAKLKKS
jgi:ATP-dependent RNA helicase SUPV3L1/SUV3